MTLPRSPYREFPEDRQRQTRTGADRRFEQGGWQVPCLDEGIGRLTADWIAAADAFLNGTQDLRALREYWPQVTDPNDPRATRLNDLPKHLVSTARPSHTLPSTRRGARR